MASIKNSTVKFSDLISSIETGQVKIPQFQRKFVWTIEDSAKLLDSVIKGYPIGTFIYWRTNETLRSVRNIGELDFDDSKEYVDYILDGQQRVTSLYAVYRAVIIKNTDDKEIDYSQIFINLIAGDNDDIVTTVIDNLDNKEYIQVSQLLKGNLKLLSSYPEEYHEKLNKYKDAINLCVLPIVSLECASMDIATEVFTRLNVGGKALTLFEIMVAKMYYSEDSQSLNIARTHFDLSEEYDLLVSDLADVDYDTIPEATVLQVISALLDKNCKRSHILKIDKERFINIWDEAINCIKYAIDYFKSYGVTAGKILPYNALLVPFSYYFYISKEKPCGDIQKLLEDFFWRASLGERYSSSVESNLAQDLQKIDSIISGKQPKYEWSVDLDEESLDYNGYFNTGSAYIKAILCLFSKQKPKSFDNNGDISLRNDWLKIATSRNYHHFFPKAWLKKQGNVEQHYINHIVNITVVDDFLNKRKIKDKKPSKYIKELESNNDGIKKTMKTHLIDIDKDGIWSDDYYKFYENRSKRIIQKLNRFIIPQNTN